MTKQKIFTYQTTGRSMLNITNDIQKFISSTQCETGTCNLFIMHTSASLIICENYDPQVRKDLEHYISKIIPDGDPMFQHNIEGPDDMPAHIRTILTQSSLTIPIRENQLFLGRWQGIYLWEHRTSPFSRDVVVTILN